MTNGQTSAIIALVLLFSVLTAAQVAMMIAMTQPQANQSPPAPPVRDNSHREQSVGMAITWRTPMMDGMSPGEVLASTIARMQYEQNTILGNDRNAKALIKAMEALAILEDRPAVTDDGFPIIE